MIDKSPISKGGHFKAAPFLQIPTQRIDIKQWVAEDGAIHLRSTVPLLPHPFRMTERLLQWATEKPDTVFLGQRGANGGWECITYRQTLDKVNRIAQWLLDQEVSVDRPVAIITDNCIEHALMALASLHIGVPFSSISPAYASKSTDLKKLRHTLDTLTPKVILIMDGQRFDAIVQQLSPRSTIVYLNHPPEKQSNSLAFTSILQTVPTPAVEAAFARIQPDTIAKVLFTSGSTGVPKGVINTHGNITTNWQQITQVFPFLEEGFELIDWLPWNHTFGGNHNLGLTLYHGGSLYIDDGKPTPGGIQTTIENLRARRPTIYFNVPKGFEELIPFLKKEEALRQQFFSQLKLLFYAGAGMAQHVWDTLEELAFQTTGKRLLIATGLGCTESSPSALFNTHFGSFAGMLGVPVPGLELKLVPVADKLEARYKGDNIMPGYWRNPEATTAAFDEEGFYKTGDALQFVNPDDPNAGMIFNGRIAEDFKLSTGTWVSVGELRSRFIATGKGLVQDVVITGHDQDFIGALVFPDIDFLKTNLGIEMEQPEEWSRHPKVREALQNLLTEFSKAGTGSSTYIRKALIAPFQLSSENGELTDKGSVNQRAVLTNRGEYVAIIYANEAHELVIKL